MYEVIWRIDIDADSPEDAARRAREVQLDPNSLATCFEVIDSEGAWVSVDLEPISEEASCAPSE